MHCINGTKSAGRKARYAIEPSLTVVPIHPSQQVMGAGSWHRHYIKQLNDPDQPSNVPCGDCYACCTNFGSRSGFRGVDLTAYDDASTYKTREVDGVVHLDIKEDGNCVYLEDGRCSIYERRPYGCRTFDCRIQIFIGALEKDEGGELTPISRAASEKFRIVCKEPDDEWLLKASGLAFIIAFAKAGNLSVSQRIAVAPELLKLFAKPDPLMTDFTRVDHAIDLLLNRRDPDERRVA